MRAVAFLSRRFAHGHSTAGKLKFDNQYDFMTDALFTGGDDPTEISGHFYGFRSGPFQKLALPGNPTGAFDWDRMGGESVNNAIRYETPMIGGFSAGSMYSFGNVAGSFGTGNGTSFGLNYTGREFGANAAYTNLKYSIVGGPDISVRNWGLGAHDRAENWFASLLFTTVHNSLNDGSPYEGSVGTKYYFTPAFTVGVSYMYTRATML